jgi:hypothetical protein
MDKKTRKANEALKKAQQVVKERKMNMLKPVRKAAEPEVRKDAFEKALYKEATFFYATLKRNVVCTSKETSMILKGQLVRVMSSWGPINSVLASDGRIGLADNSDYSRLTW